MDLNDRELIRRKIRSPRSAAIAGLIFSILLITQMIIFYPFSLALESPNRIDPDFLDKWAKGISVVLSIIPFTGIAFLWFTGVIRDWLGQKEDRFFSTIFLGSGIIFVVLLFIFAAVLGTLYTTFALSDQLAMENDIILFGHTLMSQLLGNYGLRMAGVYMLSIGTLWTRTGHAPRWLIILTYIVAIAFFLFAGSIREARFAFPAWVFVVSVYILILNYRTDKEERVG